MKESTEFIIKLVMLLVLIIINILIVFNGLTLDCAKCSILVKSTDSDFSFNLTLNEIYDNYLNNTCIYVSKIK